jgi:thioredoxin
MNIMRNLAIILGISAALLLSCSSKSGSQSASEPQQAVVTGSEGEKSGDVTAKPVHLTKETFKAKVMDFEKNPTTWVFEGDKPCIIDFYADWCKPCKMIAPIMDELAVEYAGQIDIYKVDTEDERELASVFGITSIPYVLFVPAQGNPSAQRGALPKESYKQIIDEFLLKKNQGTSQVK